MLELRNGHLSDSNMSSFSVLSRLASGSGLRRATAHVRASANRRCTRYIATQEENKKNVNEKLPLAGIRVLDMTRVLAGVNLAAVLPAKQKLTTTVALLHSDTGRSWVCAFLHIALHILTELKCGGHKN